MKSLDCMPRKMNIMRMAQGCPFHAIDGDWLKWCYVSFSTSSSVTKKKEPWSGFHSKARANSTRPEKQTVSNQKQILTLKAGPKSGRFVYSQGRPSEVGRSYRCEEYRSVFHEKGPVFVAVALRWSESCYVGPSAISWKLVYTLKLLKLSWTLTAEVDVS